MITSRLGDQTERHPNVKSGHVGGSSDIRVVANGSLEVLFERRRGNARGEPEQHRARQQDQQLWQRENGGVWTLFLVIASLRPLYRRGRLTKHLSIVISGHREIGRDTWRSTVRRDDPSARSPRQSLGYPPLFDAPNTSAITGRRMMKTAPSPAPSPTSRVPACLETTTSRQIAKP